MTLICVYVNVPRCESKIYDGVAKGIPSILWVLLYPQIIVTIRYLDEEVKRSKGVLDS